MPSIDLMFEVSQLLTFPLNDEAPRNIAPSDVTCEVFQGKFRLNKEAPLNIQDIDVTWEVSKLLKS